MPDAQSQTREYPRVLVVDDITMHRELAGAMLRGAGYHYTCVKAAAEAVAAVESGAFDVVLMDVRMPIMDGLEATRRIRALDGPRGQVPIVAMTAQDFPEQLAKCRTAGMDSYLAKPFDENALYAVVGAVGSTTHDAASSNEAWLAKEIPAPMLGSDLPILDVTTPERTAALLEPAAFKTLKNQCWAVLRALRALEYSPRPTGALIQAVHTLASCAGMFGFERLAFVARHFEHAVKGGAAETATLAGAFRAAIRATLLELHRRKPKHAEVTPDGEPA